MNKTANFELNQWDKTDRIMMEDFNTDNLRIDYAIRDSQFRVKLGEAELTEDAAALTLTVENPADYCELAICYRAAGSKAMLLTLNGAEADTLFDVTYAANPAVGKIILVLQGSDVACFHNEAILAGTNNFSRSGTGLLREVDMSIPMVIRIESDTAALLTAGTAMQVYGLKR